MWILSVLLLIVVLGVIILIHEFGHFMWAKKFGVHIYEFSIGMGPVVFTHKGKDKIDYNIRAVPIGGFVAMAGEVYEDDDSKKIPKKNFMCNKPWWQRLIILLAGVINNFILAIVLLFVSALIWGGNSLEAKVDKALKDYPMAQAGVQDGDEILAINGYKTPTWDVAQIVLAMKNKNDYYTFKVRHENGVEQEVQVKPVVEKDENGEDRTVFGLQIANSKLTGFTGSLKYAFCKFGSVMHSMWLTVSGLITGKISMKALSGPVGIYQVVDEARSIGLEYIIYITAFLSINVGFINVLPFPAFDGGRVFFLLVEKIKGSPVNAQFENMCHTIGFILLLILMVYITFQDIIRLF